MASAAAVEWRAGVLTLREVEIALCAAPVQSNKDIGAALAISWRTVSRRLATIMRISR